MRRTFWLGLLGGCVAAALTGCSPFSPTEARQQMSAGPTGCAPERVDVSEQESYAWVATCNGRRFRCSAGFPVVCTAEQPGNAPPPPAPLPPPPPEKPLPNPEDGISN